MALTQITTVGEDGARWGCGVRWGGTGIQYFRRDWVGTLVLFYSYRPETTTTKCLWLCEHCTSHEAFECENVYLPSELSVSGKASSSFSVQLKVIPGYLYTQVYLYGVQQGVLNYSELHIFFVCSAH